MNGIGRRIVRSILSGATVDQAFSGVVATEAFDSKTIHWIQGELKKHGIAIPLERFPSSSTVVRQSSESIRDRFNAGWSVGRIVREYSMSEDAVCAAIGSGAKPAILPVAGLKKARPKKIRLKTAAAATLPGPAAPEDAVSIFVLQKAKKLALELGGIKEAKAAIDALSQLLD